MPSLRVVTPPLAERLRGVTGSPVRDLLALLDRPEVISFAGGLPAAELFDRAGAAVARTRFEVSVLTADAYLTALAAEQFLLAQEGALERASAEAERAEALALSQYEKGLSEVLTLLDTRQRAFDARSTLTSVKAQRLRNRAGLYLALGGEF